MVTPSGDLSHMSWIVFAYPLSVSVMTRPMAFGVRVEAIQQTGAGKPHGETWIGASTRGTITPRQTAENRYTGNSSTDNKTEYA